MKDELMLLEININGEDISEFIPQDITLLDYLREYRHLMGAKKACGSGECGACTVIMDGETAYSCITMAIQAFGKRIETIESLGDENNLHPIQEAYIESGAIQCGYCTPGFIMSTKNLLDKNPKPEKEEIKDALTGNICRCTGYKQIIDAVEIAAKKLSNKE